MKRYKVTAENNAVMNVLAENETEAKEAYWVSLHGILGHQYQVCECFGDPKPLDRNQFSKPVKVEEQGRIK